MALVGNKVLRAITTSLVANFSTDRALLLSERISRLDLSKITAIVDEKLKILKIIEITWNGMGSTFGWHLIGNPVLVVYFITIRKIFLLSRIFFSIVGQRLLTVSL